MTSGIYTRTGDAGATSLADGTRVPKTALRIDAYGTIDEANALVGAARAAGTEPRLDAILELLQHRLYNCSSCVAAAPIGVTAEDVAFLEGAIDELEARSGAIRGFVLPGGAPAAALLHVARTVCRRAERLLWALAAGEQVDPEVLRFVNRASDLLFAAARLANKIDRGGDVLWDPRAPRPPAE